MLFGTFSGTVDGSDVTFGAVEGNQRIDFVGRLGASSLVGEYAVVDGSGDCRDDVGQFDLKKGP